MTIIDVKISNLQNNQILTKIMHKSTAKLISLIQTIRYSAYRQARHIPRERPRNNFQAENPWNTIS